MLSLLLSVALALDCKSPGLEDRSLRIAIVGGGISGLSAARTLHRNGYSNLQVFEAGSTIVPVQNYVKTKEQVYDMDLIYVPSIHWNGVGIEPEYEAILSEYHAELVTSPREFTFPTKQWKSQSPPEAFMYSIMDPEEVNATTTEILSFMENYAEFFTHHSYDGIQTCIEHNIALPSEIFQEWILRKNYIYFSKAVTRLLALYGNMPVASAPACTILMMLANKGATMLSPLAGLVAQQPEFDTSKSYPDLFLAWVAASKMNPQGFVHRLRGLDD
jgi:hypothetical protein